MPHAHLPAFMQLLQSSIQYRQHYPLPLSSQNIPYIPFSPRHCPLLDALASSPDLSHVDLLSSHFYMKYRTSFTSRAAASTF